MFFKSTFHEFYYSLTHPFQWFLLAWYDIKQRYRRSVLGPFWITISTAILIGTLGVLWSVLFKMDIHEYLPYFAIGNVVWGLVSSQLNEATDGFSQFNNIIKQHRLPYPSYILRIMSRNFIIMLHNVVIILVIVTIWGEWRWVSLLSVPGIFIVVMVSYFVSLVCAILSTRYRDLTPIIQNFVTVTYFLSPVMWKKDTLPERYHWVADYNPLSHLLDLVRLPLLGERPSGVDFLFSIGVLAFSAFVAFVLLERSRHRIAYWL